MADSRVLNQVLRPASRRPSRRPWTRVVKFDVGANEKGASGREIRPQAEQLGHGLGPFFSLPNRPKTAARRRGSQKNWGIWKGWAS